MVFRWLSGCCVRSLSSCVTHETSTHSPVPESAPRAEARTCNPFCVESKSFLTFALCFTVALCFMASPMHGCTHAWMVACKQPPHCMHPCKQPPTPTDACTHKHPCTDKHPCPIPALVRARACACACVKAMLKERMCQCQSLSWRLCLRRCHCPSAIFDVCVSIERKGERGRGGEGEREKSREGEKKKKTEREREREWATTTKTLKFHQADSRKRSKTRLRTSSVSRFSVRASCTRHTLRT